MNEIVNPRARAHPTPILLPTLTKLLLAFAPALFVPAALPGCASSDPQVGIINTIEDPGLTERQLRIELNDLLALASGILEEGANRVIYTTSDPDVRQNTLRLKDNATAMFQGATFNSDPVIGLLDLWAAVIQARQFLESPLGREELGVSQEFALETNLRVVQATEELVGRLVTPEEMDELRVIVLDWAAEHPIMTLSMARRSAAADLIEHTTSESRGAFDVIHDLKFQVDDLTERLQVYATMLPKQARWQAEIVIDNVLRGEEVTQIRADIRSIEESMERVTEVVEGTPEILATEREAVFVDVTLQREAVLAAVTREREALVAALAAERAIVLAALSGEREQLVEAASVQRLATLDTLAEERVLVLEAIDAQRLATLDALTEERKAILSFIDDERQTTVADAERIAAASLDQSFERAEGLLDRLLTRLAIFAALVLALCYVGALTLVMIRKRAPN